MINFKLKFNYKYLVVIIELINKFFSYSNSKFKYIPYHIQYQAPYTISYLVLNVNRDFKR